MQILVVDPLAPAKFVAADLDGDQGARMVMRAEKCKSVVERGR